MRIIWHKLLNEIYCHLKKNCKLLIFSIAYLKTFFLSQIFERLIRYYDILISYIWMIEESKLLYGHLFIIQGKKY